MKNIYTLIGLIVALILTGCSSGKVAMNHAEDTAKAGRDIIRVTREYNDNLIVLHREWVAMILASQPECRLTADWTLLVRTDEEDRPDMPLRATPSDEKRHNTMRLHLNPLSKKTFAKEEQILSAFSDYLTALTAYTSDTSYPVDELVNKALENASKVNSKADLSEGQKKAISSMTTFLQRLATEARHGRDIAAVLKAKGPEQSRNLDLLLTEIRRKKFLYNNTMSSDMLNFRRLNFNQRSHSKPQPEQLKQSYDTSLLLVELQEITENVIREPAAAEMAIEIYKKYNNDLLSIINDNIIDKKIKEEKVKIAKANLNEGLGYIKDFVKDLVPVLIATI